MEQRIRALRAQIEVFIEMLGAEEAFKFIIKQRANGKIAFPKCSAEDLSAIKTMFLDYYSQSVMTLVSSGTADLSDASHQISYDIADQRLRGLVAESEPATNFEEDGSSALGA